jgi:hypothetical protein
MLQCVSKKIMSVRSEALCLPLYAEAEAESDIMSNAEFGQGLLDATSKQADIRVPMPNVSFRSIISIATSNLVCSSEHMVAMQTRRVDYQIFRHRDSSRESRKYADVNTTKIAVAE